MADYFSSTNSLVKKYRDFLQQSGRVDPRPDMELTVELGRKLKENGTFDAQAEQYPDFRDQFLAATQATDRGYLGEIGAGISRGARGLAGTVVGAAALGADALGADETAKSLAKTAKEVSSSGEDVRPTVDEMGEVRNLEGGVRYGLGKIGEAIPSIAEAIITGMIGAGAGSAAPGVGTVGGGVVGLVGRKAVKDLIEKGIAKQILKREVTEEGVLAALKAGGSEELKRALVAESRAVASRAGGVAAEAINSLGLSSGEIYNDTGDVGLSLGAGAIAAVPDTILPAYMMKRFFPGLKAAEAPEVAGYIRRMFTEAAKTMPMEAGTEAFQELVGIAAEKYHNGEPMTLDQADLKRMREAAIGGAAGGLVAAPGVAMHMAQDAPAAPTEASLEARRKAASGVAEAAAPAAPAPLTRGERVKEAILLSPELQDARLSALQKLQESGNISADEKAELEVLTSIVSARPPIGKNEPVVTAPTPTTVGAPATGEVETPAAPVTAAGATPPLVSNPTPPPTATTATAAEVEPMSLGDRIRAAGAQLSSIMARLPSLDVSTAREQLDAITKAGKVNAESVAALESAIDGLKTAAVAESARMAAARVQATQDKLNARAEKVAADNKAKAEREAAKVKEQAEKAAKKIPPAPAVVPDPVVPGKPAEVVVDTPAPATLDVVTDPADTLKSDLSTALNAPTKFEAGKVMGEGIINFQALAEGLKERANGPISEETKARLRTVNFNDIVAKLLKAKTQTTDGKNKREGYFYDDKGNKSRTRTAIALLMPDNSVILSGLLPTHSVLRVGENAGQDAGPAVQRMGVQKRGKLDPNAARKVTMEIEPGQGKPVLLDDLVQWGAVPLETVSFDIAPGEIFQRFPTYDSYVAAAKGTERSTKSVTSIAGETTSAEGSKQSLVDTAEQKAAALAAQTAKASNPVDDVTEFLGTDEGAPYRKSFDRMVAKVGADNPQAIIDALPKMGRENLGVVLKELGATEDDLKAYLRNTYIGKKDMPLPPAAEVPTQAALPAPAAPAAPVAVAPAAAPIPTVTKSAIKENKPATKRRAKLDAAQARVDELQKQLVELSDRRAAAKTADERKAISIELRSVEKQWTQAQSDMEDVQLKIRRREAAEFGWAVQRKAQFDAILNRITNAGFDVNVIENELGNWARITGEGEHSVITLAMEDVANANLANVVGLTHEVGHREVDTLNPQMMASLSKAVANTISEVKDGKLIDAAKNANLNWEEKLVETTAIKLGEEGFGEQAPTLAQAIWRSVKDAYYRVGMALMKAAGMEPNDSMVLNWFENNMRRRLGGDYDFAAVDLFNGVLQRSAELVSHLTVIDGMGMGQYLDPVFGVRRDEVLPDAVAAVDWNLARERQRDPGAPVDMDYTQATGRVDVAAWAEIMPILKRMKGELGQHMSEDEFWKLFGTKGDKPQSIVDRIETRTPGASSARIGGEQMTQPMNERARYKAFRLLNAFAWLNRKRAASEQERIARHSDEIVARAERFNRIDRDLRDAEAMHSVFNEELMALVKDVAVDLDRGPDTGFAAGKLLGAIREVERLTPDEAIPTEYQTAFKSILDAGGTSIFDHLSAIAKLDLNLARMTVPEIVTAIQHNAAADPRLKSLSERKPLMVALATLARNSSRNLDLLQLRTMKDTAQYLAIRAEMNEIKTMSEARIEEVLRGIKETDRTQGLRDRLRYEYAKAKRDLNSSQRAIQKAQENILLRQRFVKAVNDRATELSRDVGAFSFWEAVHNASYNAMRQKEDGTWEAQKRTLQMVGPEFSAQHQRISEDIAANRRWLADHKEQAGSRLFEEVSRQTQELSKIDFSRNYEAAHRLWFDKYLAPMGQKFGAIGEASGLRVKQMLNQFQGVLFAHESDIGALAKRWTHALQQASDAAGFSNSTNFFDNVMNDVIYQIESDPGREESAALREARRAAKLRIPEGYKVDPSFGEKLNTLLALHKQVSESFNAIAEKNGLYVNDPRVRDPLTGKGNLQRHAIKYGWLTGSRRLNADIVKALTSTMQKLGWAEKPFTDLKPNANIDGLVERYFTPEVVNTFVDPFVRKPGKEVFFGANNSQVSQVEAQMVWEKSGGNVLAFIDGLFDRTNQANDRSGLGEYRVAMLNRFQELYQMEAAIVARASKQRSAFDPFGARTHRLMDGRTNDLIPPEHFRYDMFDPSSARKMLSEIAWHAAFGRDGKALDQTLQDLHSSLDERITQYKLLPAGTKAERKAFAEAQGWDLEKLEQAYETKRELEPLQAKLIAHFHNHEALIGDARAALSLAQLNTSLLLNQPRSGLMDLTKLLEYPLVYGGISKASVRASATAVRIFARQVAASVFHDFLSEHSRVTDYAEDVAEYIEKRKLNSLPMGVLMSDIGPEGRYAAGGIGNAITKYTQKANEVLNKTVGKGGFNALWSPFRFLSHKSDVALATGNVQALEAMVSKTARYFSEHPEAASNPSFRVTAKDLGMDRGGWFSDESAFNYFRQRLIDYNLGNVEDIAREAMTRMAKGERILSKDQALGAAMMALNEISLQTSINTRPEWMLNNPLARMGGLLLGWPLARMNQVHNAMRTPDGVVTVGSVSKAIGIMAAWTLPAALAYSLLMDEYDDKFLGKKSNLRKIDPLAITPIIGPAIATANKPSNFLAMIERLSRAGTYGLGGDFVNSLTNWVDPTSGQRDFDLNSRVLVYSQYANIRDALRNWVHQDWEATYGSTGRPLINAMGGGGMLQAMQIVNNAFDLSNAEQAVTNRINVSNYLRAAGREADIELKAGAGRSSPTARSVWFQQMMTSALANDRVGFAEAYRNAVEVARREGEPDPEKVVVEGFKERNPLSAVFARKPTEVQMAKLMGALDERGQQAVREAMTLFEGYSNMIAPNPILQHLKTQQAAQVRAMQPPTIEQLRRRAASGAMGY